MLPNLRYALRTLLASPGFTIVSLLTLALGIGVNSSMFSLMNTLLFATAPFPRPESIITLNGQTPDAEFIGFSAVEIEELRNHPTQAFTAIAPMSGTMETVSLPDQLPEQMQGTAAKATRDAGPLKDSAFKLAAEFKTLGLAMSAVTPAAN